MKSRRGSTALLLGVAFTGLGIALGAFGAHGLRSMISKESLEVFETGVRYQMYHGFGLMIVGILGKIEAGSEVGLRNCALFFSLGITLFSGSLYALSFTGLHWIGFVTPLGGLAFLAGWIALFLALLHQRDMNPAG